VRLNQVPMNPVLKPLDSDTMFMETSRKYNLSTDKISHDVFLKIYKTSDFRSKDQSNRYWSGARRDIYESIRDIRSTISNIEDLAKKSCDKQKCERVAGQRSTKSMCSEIICGILPQWRRQLDDATKYATTGRWRGVSGDKTPMAMSVEDLIELKNTLRKYKIVNGSAVVEMIKSINPSLAVRFRNLLQRNQLKGRGESIDVEYVIQIALIIMLILIVINIVQLISQYYSNSSAIIPTQVQVQTSPTSTA